MKISRKEVGYIMSLTRTEKPEKYIMEYINSLGSNKERCEKRLEMYHRTYKAAYANYFFRFAGRYKDECIMEAYVKGLEMLRQGEELDAAFEHGVKAGAKLFTIMSKEALFDNFDGVYEEEDDE